MIEGLFWVAVLGALYFIVDKVTDVKPAAKEQKTKDPGWVDRKTLEVFTYGLFAFLGLGALLVFL